MDSLIKVLTAIGIIAAIGFIGKLHYDHCKELKHKKELRTEIDEKSKKIAEQGYTHDVDYSSNCKKSLETELAKLDSVQNVIDSLATEKLLNTWTYQIPHDGDPNTSTVPITLDGSESSATEDGEDISYKWKIYSDVNGNGSLTTVDGEEITFEGEAGEHMVQLIVTDSYGARDKSTKWIDIKAEDNKDPEAVIEKK